MPLRLGVCTVEFGSELQINNNYFSQGHMVKHNTAIFTMASLYFFLHRDEQHKTMQHSNLNLLTRCTCMLYVVEL